MEPRFILKRAPTAVEQAAIDARVRQLELETRAVELQERRLAATAGFVALRERALGQVAPSDGLDPWRICGLTMNVDRKSSLWSSSRGAPPPLS